MTLSNIDEIKQLKVLGKSSLFSGIQRFESKKFKFRNKMDRFVKIIIIKLKSNRSMN